MNEILVEAVLFSAGKPVSIEDISKTAGLPAEDTKAAIKKLSQGYQKRETAIEISKVGSKYVMQLKPDVLGKAGSIAPATIPKSILKTAALIAYHQPVKQSKLLVMVGGNVYEHVRYLTETGLITTKKFGNTYILTTSKKFPEFFGIPTSKREDIRRWIAKQVGVTLPPPGMKKNGGGEDSQDACEGDRGSECADSGDPDDGTAHKIG